MFWHTCLLVIMKIGHSLNYYQLLNVISLYHLLSRCLNTFGVLCNLPNWCSVTANCGQVMPGSVVKSSPQPKGFELVLIYTPYRFVLYKIGMVISEKDTG